MLTSKEKSLMGSPSKIIVPDEFIYEYDFDENGLLFFLGTYGKTRPWQNPHILGQTQVFSSSLGSGQLLDFVGRESTNLRTQNEAFSYFGIDLGTSRLFIPICYSIRNRNASTYKFI